MRTLVANCCLVVLVLVSAGCASQKVTHERGWVGGEFMVAQPPSWVTADDAGTTIHAFPRELVGSQKAAIFVSSVHSNTPLALAGIQVGDLILAVGAEPIESLAGFRRVIDGAQPGTTIPVTVFRQGTRQDRPISIGRETYENWKYFAVGFGLSTKLEFDLFPDPDFSLVAVGYRQDRKRVELHSPRNEFIHQTRVDKDQPSDDRSASVQGEGWRAWLAIFSLGGHKSILGQEVVIDTPVALRQ
jgi:hypothetical protein